MHKHRIFTAAPADIITELYNNELGDVRISIDGAGIIIDARAISTSVLDYGVLCFVLGIISERFGVEIEWDAA